MANFVERIQHAWNAFTSRDPTDNLPYYGPAYSIRPDRSRVVRSGEKSIVNNIYNRIAVDVSQIDIRHVKTDENGNFLEEVNSGLDNILQLEANIDQTSRSFIIDIVISMFDEGVVAVVPVDTSLDPNVSTSYQILTARTARILQWYPKHIRVHIYNDTTGRYEDITLPKNQVAIIENPFYATMNEPNSTLKRLVRKINLLDQIDEDNGAGKLDMIIQLPYVIRTENRRKEAEKRRKQLEMQLAGSKYGIGYAEATEKIVQLNRSVDNTLEKQVEDLTNRLYRQLGLTEGIFEGTADAKQIENYYSRTIEPILCAITEEFKRKFLTKTARTQHQSIMFFRNPLKLVPITDLASVSDSFTRNEILTSNEFRSAIGFKPSDDPNADKLHNSNLYPYEQETGDEGEDPGYVDDTEDSDSDPMSTPMLEVMPDDEDY